MNRFRTFAILAALAVMILSQTLALAQGPKPSATSPAGAWRTTKEGWFAKPKRSMPLPALPDKVQTAVVIPIREEISNKTYETMLRKITRCKGLGVKLIIFDMDTFGGGVLAALDISRMIKTELSGIRSVCFVRTRAISAGALIALACDEIVMTPVGKLGDCAPISPQGKLEGVEREKIESPLRAEFSESATLRGYSVPLAESMVSWHREVWLVRNIKTRELRYVAAENFRAKVAPVEGNADTGLKRKPKIYQWELLRVVVQEEELLTMDTAKALDLGFVAATIEATTQSPHAGIKKHYNIQELQVFEDNWSETAVGFLTSATVTGILLMAGVFLIYAELQAPGFGIAGGLAAACFAVMFGSRYLIGLAQVWEIALFVVGIVLLLVEVFVIPGFGLAGLSGILCCIIGLLAIIVPNAPNEWPVPITDMDWGFFHDGLMAMGLGLIGAFVLASLLAKYFRRIPFASRMILAEAVAATEAPTTDTSPMQHIGVGDIGIVDSICRPVGKVRFGDELFDASGDGVTIETGKTVRVIRKDSNRLIVEKI